MTEKKFRENVNKTLNECVDLLFEKSTEYSTDDKFHNFKQSAHLQGIRPIDALAGMMSKHTISIYDFITSGKQYSKEKWKEKIHDNINYLLLLSAMLEETECYMQPDKYEEPDDE